MSKVKQSWSVAMYNFRQWKKNPRIVVTFALAFILCFLLSNRAVQFAQEQGTIMQLVEAFVWTFGDANNILISSLLLVLLFADMPFICEGTPFYLMRTTRASWLMGQIIYICMATVLYMAFILLATSALCAHNSFIGDQWSETAAMLGYSGAGEAVALPAFVKTLEMSTPYACMGTIFLLMLLYTLLMVSVMLAVNIRKGQFWGVISAFLFSLYGLLLNPQVFGQMFGLPQELMYKANVAVGWMSPLNQATYHMHNFGYDLLPRLWQTYLIFGAATVLLFLTALRGMKKYNFNFTGSGV
ncbi:hypothetical protein [Christensenella intestinihominis]|uniref:hypothetical protein n=1 Tax=Christensenella intestinihominis TaxID=1851429 RepID=UPI00082E8DD7|nr:hypothetical protein [Christensenella intestinihominis]